MAKTSSVARNEKRKALVVKFAEKRKILKDVIVSSDSSWEEKQEAMLLLAKLPRNSSKTRVRNRCQVTGRSRGYIRDYALGRSAFRKLAHEGMIPGIVKSSW
jgi:small subunit ribosomal protein S14